MTFEAFSPRFEENKNKPQNTNEELANILQNESLGFKNELKELKQSMENLNNYNESLKLANTEIRNLLRNSKDSLTETDKTNQLIMVLSLQPENPIAKSYLKLLYVLQLKEFWEVQPEEIIKWVSDVLEDKNIPYIMKKWLVNWLKENDYLVWDNLHQVEIENSLQIKFPQYSWSNFQPTIDPQDGNLTYTNTFAA